MSHMNPCIFFFSSYSNVRSSFAHRIIAKPRDVTFVARVKEHRPGGVPVIQADKVALLEGASIGNVEMVELQVCSTPRDHWIGVVGGKLKGIEGLPTACSTSCRTNNRTDYGVVSHGSMQSSCGV